MKKFFVIAALATFMFASCSSDDTLNDNEQVTNPTSQTETVILTFSPYVMESMAKTRATTDIGTLTDRLDVWIMEGDAITAPSQKPVGEFHQQKSDEGFGTVTLKLNRDKTYTLYAIAHKESAATTFSNGVVTFTDTKKLQTFAYSQTFSPATTTTLSCVMQRCVGAFSLRIKDVISTDVKKFSVSISNAPTQYSFTEQKGINPSTEDYKVEWTSWNETNDGVQFNVYVFGGNTQSLHNVTVTAYGADGAIIKQRQFTDVPIINNHKTIYRGSFFQDTTFNPTFQIEDDWTEDRTEF